MLRLFISVTVTSLFLTGCSLNAVKKGGKNTYLYSSQKEYKLEELKPLSSDVVTILKREPRVGTLKDLFSKDQAPIRRIGIVVFETMIKNSITGLSTDDRVYLSDQGKQLITEKLLSMWEQGLPMVDPELDLVKTREIKKTKDFKTYGSDVSNYIHSKRTSLAPDDVFFLEKGKKISMHINHNPRGMRDVSFLLVPGTDLMAGPKWSEANKHFVNDIAKNLNLDAVIIVQSKLDWTAESINKNSGEITPEEMTIQIKSSTLIPLSRYNSRLEKLKLQNQTPNHTLCYGTYEGEIKAPVNLKVSKEDESFETAMKEVINPALKIYRDLAFMTMMRLTDDLKQTR